jgi:integrase/recombinase XerD
MDARRGRKQKRERDAVTDQYELGELFERFYCAKVTEGRTKRTLDSYRENYGYLVEYMNESGLGQDIRNITVDFIRDYITYMLNEREQFDGHRFKLKTLNKVGLSPSTVNLRLKVWRTFFKFMNDEGQYCENPFAIIKKVREVDNGIDVLSVEQLRAILNAPDKRSYAGFRDHVLITVLLDIFGRIFETLSLKFSDIDVETCSIRISAENTKSRKYKHIPIQKRTLKLLLELIDENSEFETDYVFLANYGDPLKPSQFRHRLKEHVKKAGINRRVYPHLLRHSAATLFLEAGGDIRHLQMLLNHKDLRMVIRYTHLSQKSLTEQHGKYTPLNEIYGSLSKERKILRQCTFCNIIGLIIRSGVVNNGNVIRTGR